VSGNPVSITSVHVPVETTNWRALSVAAPRDPAIVLLGVKWAAPPVTVESQSNQYVPGCSVVPMLTVFAQIFRVVPGAVPGGGATVLKMRNSVESTEEVRRFVVVFPNTTVLPASPGRPFQICSVYAVNGDGDAGPPVR